MAELPQNPKGIDAYSSAEQLNTCDTSSDESCDAVESITFCLDSSDESEYEFEQESVSGQLMGGTMRL